MKQDDFSQMIEEYPLDYCHFLEAVYGDGMMSEGGAEAIETMFKDLNLQDKVILDIGSGLGGVAIYLAKNYGAKVIGMDINPDMIAEANTRIPKDLQEKIKFVTYDDVEHLSFPDYHFDIVYSKGVLTHVFNKLPLFKEVHRVLIPHGKFIINDWLSPVDEQWGPQLQKMCEIEGLTLHAVSPATYQNILQQAQFNLTKEKDETEIYARYNHELVSWLENPNNAAQFKKQFGEAAWQEAVQGHHLIAGSMDKHELKVMLFIAEKAHS